MDSYTDYNFRPTTKSRLKEISTLISELIAVETLDIVGLKTTHDLLKLNNILKGVK